MSKNDGGAAFPFFCEATMNSPEYGMSLRDFFAAKAMQGVISGLANAPQTMTDDDCGDIAAFAYALAEAMIAERAK